MAALVALGLTACQSGDDGDTASDPTSAAPTGECGRARPAKAGVTQAEITSHGFKRQYSLYAPASYTGRRRVPVLLEFHGYGSTPQQQLIYGSFGTISEREGFVIVAPAGQGPNRHFNLIGPAAGEQDDVQFVADLLDHIERRLCVDTTRVYTTGMSNGGAMSAVLACRMSDRIAAFASVAATVWAPQCGQARTVPIMAMHGTADPIVPFDGGRVNCCGNPTIPSTPGTMANWAAHDGCAPEPVEEPVAGSVRVRRWTACKPGGDVRLYIVEGGGHTWPGARVGLNSLGSTNTDIDASAVIWEFFADKRLPD